VSAPILTVEELHVHIGAAHVLRGVSFEVAPGEAVGLVGETGSGKTMTVRAITGLLPSIKGRVTAGAITIEGADATDVSEKAWRRWQGKTLALVPQSSMSSLSPLRRVRSQLAETVRRVDRGSDVDAEVAALLESVHLPPSRELLNSYPHELSGGMRQRVMIALALAVKPRLLVADEPTTALDVAVRGSILELLRELRVERNLALVMISHDIGAIARSTDRIVVMYGGRSVESGRTRDVLAEPRHPYTDALLAAMPQRTPAGEPLPVVPGQPPRPEDAYLGCAFAERCPAAMDACATQNPASVQLPADRQVACLIAEQTQADPHHGTQAGHHRGIEAVPR
jgi:oligopeptide/dipeptide ABC transporter ATP-binding protein